MEPKPPKKNSPDTDNDVDLDKTSYYLPSGKNDSDTDNDVDLDKTNYYLPSKKSSSNTRKAVDLGKTMLLNEPPPEPKPLEQESPPQPLSRPIVTGQLSREAPVRKTSPRAAEDSLRPTEFELPHQSRFSQKGEVTLVDRPTAGRNALRRSVRYGVLIALSLGALGLLIVSFLARGPSNLFASVLPSGKQEPKAVLRPSTPVNDNKSGRTEIPSVQATTPINAPTEKETKQIAPEAEALPAWPSGKEADKAVLPTSMPVSDNKSGRTEKANVPATTPVSVPAKEVRKQIAPASEPSSERVAVDSLISGRADEALASYRKLAQKHPDQPVYGAIAKILKRRIEQRCSKGSQLGDLSCDKSLQ